MLFLKHYHKKIMIIKKEKQKLGIKYICASVFRIVYQVISLSLKHINPCWSIHHNWPSCTHSVYKVHKNCSQSVEWLHFSPFCDIMLQLASRNNGKTFSYQCSITIMVPWSASAKWRSLTALNTKGKNASSWRFDQCKHKIFLCNNTLSLLSCGSTNQHIPPVNTYSYLHL